MIKVSNEPMLTKTDRNGTQYFTIAACPKCNGTGFIYGYEHIEGGRCFLCGGDGYHPHTFKVMTPEYEAKLQARRDTKVRSQANEINLKNFNRLGFNCFGVTYVVFGNTFEVKEQLKEAGAHYNNWLGWHFYEDHSEFKCVKLEVSSFTSINDLGLWSLDECEIKDAADELKKSSEIEYNRNHCTSDYIGSVNDKIEIVAKFDNYFTFSTRYSYRGELHYIYKFKTENGSILIWKTSKALNISIGDMCNIKGTIKELSEYNGEKQTIITRAKVNAYEN